MTDPAYRTYTEEEYLGYSSPERVRWEYVDGFVYAQAGASRPHGLIAGNILRVCLNATADGPCATFASDLKVRVVRDGNRRYYLPDIVVVCDSNMVGDVETQPCLIVEILSASTRNIDLTFKVSDYQRIESLQGYLTVDSEARGVIFHRRTQGGWQFETVDEAVELPCLGLSLSVAEIYRNVGL